MDDVTGDWDRPRTERFLDEHAVPVRIACRTGDDGLWMLSLWFRYDDGHLRCATGANARVVDYLRADPTVAFEVSTNRPPYMGVRGAGTATVESEGGKPLLRELLERYLGGTDSDLARRLLSPDREEVVVDVDIERAYTWDFSDRMGGDPSDE
jgi:nitroimidazol reductase NimA-like FMN-containing flavoprotein (pyridoxamine 5'-phosphate oxidase superfamily)